MASPAALLISFGLMGGWAHGSTTVANGASTTAANGADASRSNAFLVMLDPGHGGRDRGATHGTLRESEIALKVALKLSALLKDDPRFQVAMTRDSDRTLTLEERAKLSAKSGADLFLSIHLNSSSDARAQGKEFYFQNQLPVDEESMFLASRENNSETPEPGTHQPRAPSSSAERPALNKDVRTGLNMDVRPGLNMDVRPGLNMDVRPGLNSTEAHAPETLSKRGDVRSIIDDLERNQRILASSELSRILFETWTSTAPGGTTRHTGSRAIRQAPFFVVANSRAPAVLVELGFITHPIEGPRLALSSYQDELAQSLYKGLSKFKETMDKEHVGPLNSAHDQSDPL